MIYVVRQRVSHPESPNYFIKISKIVGNDLKHAAELLPIGEAMRRDIERTGKTSATDSSGRKVEIEVIEEEKA